MPAAGKPRCRQILMNFALFHVAGADHRRLGICDLKGYGLLLFFFFHLLPSGPSMPGEEIQIPSAQKSSKFKRRHIVPPLDHAVFSVLFFRMS